VKWRRGLRSGGSGSINMAYEDGPECRASCKVFEKEAHTRGMNGKVSSLSTFEIAFTDQFRTRAGTP